MLRRIRDFVEEHVNGRIYLGSSLVRTPTMEVRVRDPYIMTTHMCGNVEIYERKSGGAIVNELDESILCFCFGYVEPSYLKYRADGLTVALLKVAELYVDDINAYLRRRGFPEVSVCMQEVHYNYDPVFVLEEGLIAPENRERILIPQTSL